MWVLESSANKLKNYTLQIMSSNSRCIFSYNEAWQRLAFNHFPPSFSADRLCPGIVDVQISDRLYLLPIDVGSENQDWNDHSLIWWKACEKLLITVCGTVLYLLNFQHGEEPSVVLIWADCIIYMGDSICWGGPWDAIERSPIAIKWTLKMDLVVRMFY